MERSAAFISCKQDLKLCFMKYVLHTVAVGLWRQLLDVLVQPTTQRTRKEKMHVKDCLSRWFICLKKKNTINDQFWRHANYWGSVSLKRACSGQKTPDYPWGRLSEARGDWGSGNLEGEGLGKGLEQGRSVYKQPETKVDGSCHS